MRIRPADQYFERFMPQQPYPRCPIEPYSPITLYGNVLFLVQGRERQINRVLPTVNISSLVEDSVVGIATGYGQDGTGIESRWVARFSAPVQTGPEAHTQPPVPRVPGL
jgi:hypothetical protein